MRIAYLKVRNLDSHWRKALSYWIGVGVLSLPLATTVRTLTRETRQEKPDSYYYYYFILGGLPPP